MATRFYFPADTASAVTPVANGAWGNTTGALNRKLVRTTKSNTALTNGTQRSWTVGQTALDRRYVSDPLEGSQAVTGTVKCYLMAREFNNGDNSTSRMEAYVVTRDGGTVRGTFLAIGQYGPATELINNATLRNKAFADGDAVSSVTTQDGDRIVVCIGYTDTAGASPEGQCKYGDPTSGTDLAENETGTTANPGWIEFSFNFTFESGTTFDGAAALTGVSGFTSAATRSTAGASSTAGTGAVTANATISVTGACVTSGTGTVTASGTRVAFGAALFADSSAFTAVATGTYQGTCTMVSNNLMTAASPNTFQGSAAIVSNLSLVATPTVVKNVHVSHRGGSTSATDGL